MKRGFLIAKGRESSNFVKERGPSMDDGPNVGNGGEASGSVTSNIGDSPSPAGKRVAYLIVENYMKNTWGKFGLVKSMIIKDMHFFKFGSKEGMASYARAMIQLKVDVHLKDTIVFHVPNSA
ncbi:hypothetical protein Tco_1260231, partial [Tanacetum coccineum]